MDLTSVSQAMTSQTHMLLFYCIVVRGWHALIKKLLDGVIVFQMRLCLCMLMLVHEHTCKFPSGLPDPITLSEHIKGLRAVRLNSH